MNRTAKTTAPHRALHNHGKRGVAAVEFALTLSLWMVLLLGIADGSYFLLVNERVDRIAYTVNDIVTQYDKTPSPSQFADIMLAAEQLMSPMSFNPSDLGTQNEETGDYPAATGYIIVTSVYEDPTEGAIVEWQYSYPPPNNGVTLPTSLVGTSATGSPATLPAGLTLNDQENVIITEVYYTFKPLFVDQFLSKVISRLVVYKPRLSQLVDPPA